MSRITVPYGPNLFGDPPLQTAEERPWRGYGFGMGASEELAFDTKEKYAYIASAVGFVTVVDFAQPETPLVTDYAISFDELEEMNDLVVRTLRSFWSGVEWLFFIPNNSISL